MHGKLCKHLRDNRSWQFPGVSNLPGADPCCRLVVPLRQIAGGRDGLLRKFADFEHDGMWVLHVDDGEEVMLPADKIHASEAMIGTG